MSFAKRLARVFLCGGGTEKEKEEDAGIKLPNRVKRPSLRPGVPYRPIPTITITPPSPVEDEGDYGTMQLEDAVQEQHGDVVILCDPTELRARRPKLVRT